MYNIDRNLNNLQVLKISYYLILINDNRVIFPYIPKNAVWKG